MRKHVLYVLRLRFDSVRLERIERDDPRRDRVGKVLRVEGGEGVVLKPLDVACRPVVEHGKAEDVALSIGDGDPAEVGVRHADEGAELDLDVQFARGCQGWWRCGELAVGADDGGVRDEDG